MEKIENFEHLLMNVKYYFENFEKGIKLDFNVIEGPYKGIDDRDYEFAFSLQKPHIHYRITSRIGTNPHLFKISSIQEFEDSFGSK